MRAREPRVDGYVAMMQGRSKVPVCAENVDTKALPDNCFEVGLRPEDLSRKLDEWGFDALVIPHGTAWGLSNPPSADLAHELTPAIANDPRQQLVEVYSGHGNSEQYRSWREYLTGPNGEKVCPAPNQDYLPMCCHAGRIIRSHCDAQHLPAQECERRERETRQRELDAPVGFAAAGFFALPGASTGEVPGRGACPGRFPSPPPRKPPGSGPTVFATGGGRPRQHTA